jgi:adenylate kinase
MNGNELGWNTTLHVQDLASVIHGLLETPPSSQQYIVAVDQSYMSQKQVVTTIAQQLGNGVVTIADVQADEQQLLASIPNAEVLLADMKFKRDIGFVNNSLQDMDWVAQSGFKKKFDRVKQEYIRARNLAPVRLFVHGAPGSGKSFYAAQLAKQHHLPHLKIYNIIREVLDRKDALAEQVLKSMQQPSGKASKRRAGGATSAAAAAAAAKRDKATGTARIPVELLTQLVRAKLNTACCRNRGFVLDGFPRTYDEARALWRVRKSSNMADGDEDEDDLLDAAEDEDEEDLDEELEEDEDDDDDDEDDSKKKVLHDPNTVVNYVIVLNTTKQDAAARFKALAPELVKEGHNDEAGFKRRWALWESINNPDARQLKESQGRPLAALQYLDTVEAFEVPSPMTVMPKQALNAMNLYLCNQQKSYNYHPTPEEVLASRQAAAHDAAAAAAQAAIDVKEQKDLAADDRIEKKKQNEVRRAKVIVQDQELVEACSQPLRRYLMDNVIPSLVDGMLNICKVQPEDPIDYLAEYLFNKAELSSSQ